MRKVIGIILAVVLITLIVPLITYIKNGKYEKPAPETEEVLKVYIKDEDRVVEMSKSQYLKEVVSAEMPADFEFEALKAQAVAARSYLDSRRNAYKASGTPPEHKGAEICTDSTHCKAWISESKRRELWGEDADKNWDKISRAVTETQGQIITYNGEVISAVFHSTSSGKTEASKDVWGGDKPYLVSVDSPGDMESPKYKSRMEITLSEFKQIAEQNIPEVDFSKGIIDGIKRSDAGGITEVAIGGVRIHGTKLRSIYGLRSTNANIEILEDKIIFDVTGYGHGVGMSQYGANYMAKEGKDYKEILTTYYQGTEVTG